MSIVDVSPQPEHPETYLGDGLYVSFDGYQIMLRAPRIEGDSIVFLEPQVYVALTEFVKRLSAS